MCMTCACRALSSALTCSTRRARRRRGQRATSPRAASGRQSSGRTKSQCPQATLAPSSSPPLAAATHVGRSRPPVSRREQGTLHLDHSMERGGPMEGGRERGREGREARLDCAWHSWGGMVCASRLQPTSMSMAKHRLARCASMKDERMPFQRSPQPPQWPVVCHAKRRTKRTHHQGRRGWGGRAATPPRRIPQLASI